MKTLRLIGLLLILGKAFPFSVMAQAAATEGQINQWLANLQAAPGDAGARFKAAWELSVIGPAARKAVPALVKVLTNPEEHPRARMSAFNALGHIGVSEKGVVDQITQALNSNPKVFGGAGGNAVVNGSFEFVSTQNDLSTEKGAFGETMFQPGSLDLAGWMTYAGVTMFQDEGARPGGEHSLELGPRDVPGCVSQTIQTTVGRTYELKLFTCTGRGFAHFNRQLRVRVAGIDKTVDCAVGDASELVIVPFQAVSAFTTMTFCGVGSQGFGPVIDEVTIAAASGAAPEPPASDSSRLQQLEALAQRIRSRFDSPGRSASSSAPVRVISAETQPEATDLLSEAGRQFVGHQLEFLDAGEPGVLSARKPAWISLWIPFRVRVSESMIEYSFGGNVARLPGPLDTDGANKLTIAPGTRLRNLRLQIEPGP